VLRRPTSLGYVNRYMFMCIRTLLDTMRFKAMMVMNLLELRS